MLRSAFKIHLLLLAGMASHSAWGQSPDRIRFNEHVRPILQNHCWSCHGPDDVSRQAGLRFDRRDSVIGNAESGKVAIVPGQPAVSELIARIESHDEDALMPPTAAKKPLTAKQRQVLRQWIEQGADFASHWAFNTPQRPEVPTVKQFEWPRNNIDRFVLRRLEDNGLAPSPGADPAVWLRRVTLDLTGLPPSVEELDAFTRSLEQESPATTYERVVDQLLSSPRHAERMAMHWLDAARYADTNGYNNDENRTMWPWRDWVIDAFARGMPYDQFLTEQLAGDLLPDATLSQKVATGFNRNHVLTTEGGIIEEEYHVEYVADRVHTTATVFLALSMQCARCHDHKYDSISQREYYQFAAFFNNVPDKVVPYSQGRMAAPLLKVPSATQQAELARIDARRGAIESQLKARETNVDHADTEFMQLKAELAGLPKRRDAIESTIPVTMVMAEQPDRRPTFVLKRGQYDQRGEEVAAALPSLLAMAAGQPPVDAKSAKSVTRLDLTRWLTNPAHPLTTRVAVNRWWEMLFGTGLVETAEDFGVQGSSPSHPELLDWLATELIYTGWDQRAILKQIVLSGTYQQTARVATELLERDPRNRLLARGARFRLSAESVRDNALFVSGLLQEQLGGPSVKPYQPEGLWEDVSVERRDKYVPDRGDGLYRRSMYTFWKRTCPPPGMSTFDAPDRETCVIRRARTNTPLQALVLLNDPTYIEAARMLAARVLVSAKSDEDRLTIAFKLVVSRKPDTHEQETMLSLIQTASHRFTADQAAAKNLVQIGSSPPDAALPISELAAWTTAMSMLLNLDEAISRP